MKELFWWIRYPNVKEGLTAGRKNIYHYTQKYELVLGWNKDVWNIEKVSEAEAIRILKRNAERISEEGIEDFIDFLIERNKKRKCELQASWLEDKKQEILELKEEIEAHA
jgi:hypothetical protein